jgi:circadian clock protein KaiC
VELEEIAREILEQFERVRPTRLVLDSLSEIRLLAEDPARYRRELLTLSDRLGQACTGLLIDVESTGSDAAVAETLVSGVVQLDQLSPAYGGERRRLRIRKLRASQSVGGYHDFVIRDQGIEVYPRLVAAPHRTVLMGPSGSGKTTIAAQFVAAAAARGAVLVRREPDELAAPGQQPRHPASRARGGWQGEPPGDRSRRVHAWRAGVPDSHPGRRRSSPCRARQRQRLPERHAGGAVPVGAPPRAARLPVGALTVAQHGFMGETDAPVQLTYVADTAIVFRYSEAAGEVRLALSVVKKRTGSHERSIRELKFGPDGVRIGPPLANFQGILTGTPVYVQDALRGGEGEPSK